MTKNTYERRNTLDSDSVKIEKAVERVDYANDSRGIEVDTSLVVRSDDLDFEKFMAEELEVFLQEPNNESDAQFVEVNVNGDYRMAVRGTECRLRRYHVAVLARAKQSRVRQKRIVNHDGSMGFQEETVLALTYPFSVMSDPSPKRGGAWLKQILTNPV